MTKKDYQLIANAIARVESESYHVWIRSEDKKGDSEIIGHLEPPTEELLRRITATLADALAADNPRFNRKTFTDAAGIPTLESHMVKPYVS
tara:strand:- start:1633 stop:1905 length:273 start_codon:yes stop_codon:yes gene_type:complete